MLRLTRPWRQLAALSAASDVASPANAALSQRLGWSALCGASVPLLTTVALRESAREMSTLSKAAAQRGILDRILQDERLEKWAAVSRSMQASLQHVGPWSLGDLSFGLRAVAEKHAEEDAEDAVKGTAITDRAFVERLLEDVWIAEAVHQDDADAMAAMCALKRRHIVEFDSEADHFQTAFAIALWPERKEVVLVIRGTTSLADALTDLSGHLVPFGGGGGEGDVLKGNNTVDGSDSAAGSSGSSDDSQHGSQGTAATASSEGGDDSSGSRDGNGTGGGAADTSRRQAGSGSSSSGGCSNAEGDSEGMAHHGILKAAQSLLQQQGDALGQLLQDNPGHKLKILGHSLGAGTACMLAMLVRNSEKVRRQLGSPEVACVAFATPPVVTKELALGCGDYITTVVYQHDVIPRASLAGFEALRREMIETQWEENLTAELKSNRAFQLALGARTSLDHALDDVIDQGLKKRSAAALQAVTSAYVGAKGAVLARLGRTSEEAQQVGAGMGKGVERAREVAAGERSSTQAASDADTADARAGSEAAAQQPADRSSGTGAQQGRGAGSGGNAQAAVGDEEAQEIPELFAPGRLLYIRKPSDDGPFELLQAEPPEQRFRRIVLNEYMVDHHRCTNYIAAIQGVLEASKSS